MNAPSPVHDEDQGEEVFLDESYIINEYDVDEEGMGVKNPLVLSCLLAVIGGYLMNFKMRMMEALMEKKVPILLMIQYTYLLVIQMNYTLLYEVQGILHWLQLAVVMIKDSHGNQSRRLAFALEVGQVPSKRTSGLSWL